MTCIKSEELMEEIEIGLKGCDIATKVMVAQSLRERLKEWEHELLAAEYVKRFNNDR